MRNVWILEDDYQDGLLGFESVEKLYYFLIKEKIIKISFSTFKRKVNSSEGFRNKESEVRRVSAFRLKVR